MSEAKHTPGPWFVNESEDKYDQARNWRRIVTVKNKPGNIEVVPVIKWEFEKDKDGVYGGNAITKADAHLIAAAPEMLEALKACCIATQGKRKAFCECLQHDSRPYLDMEGVCWFGESGNCSIWKAIQKGIK